MEVERYTEMHFDNIEKTEKLDCERLSKIQPTRKQTTNNVD